MATEKRRDLVDREAVKDAIGFMNLHFLGHGENKSVLDSINEVPSVDAVEVVHGKWKAHKPDCRGYTAGFVCSSCGNITYTDYCMKECDYNYCPNCGARMMDGYGMASCKDC